MRVLAFNCAASIELSVFFTFSRIQRNEKVPPKFNRLRLESLPCHRAASLLNLLTEVTF